MQDRDLIQFVFKEIHFGQLHREWIYVVKIQSTKHKSLYVFQTRGI